MPTAGWRREMSAIAWYALATTCCLGVVVANLGLIFRKLRRVNKRLAFLEASKGCKSWNGPDGGMEPDAR